MNNYILFDEPQARIALLPLTFTRPVSEIRIGIQTITEKWEDFLQTKISFATEDYLQQKYPIALSTDNIFINGAICPTLNLVKEIINLPPGSSLYYQNDLLAFRAAVYTPEADFETVIQFDDVPFLVKEVTDIFLHNGSQIKEDFARITANRTSQPITDRFTAFYNEPQIFVEEGADIKNASLNAENGPIYIGKGAKIMEGAKIQGPFAICENSVVNLGGKMRPNTTIGPFCKVGGEVSNSVIFGNSNKGHEGFMGNSVIGEWCNWGADTNNSNLKNDYSKVELWNYATNRYEKTELQFTGLIMGDHSKCGINTMFNTGTIVGVNCNIIGAGFQPKHIPSFSWGGPEEFRSYHPRKAFQVARAVFERRGKVFDAVEEAILLKIFEMAQPKNS